MTTEMILGNSNIGGMNFNGIRRITKENSLTLTGLIVGKRYICVTNQCFTSGNGGTILLSGAAQNMTPDVQYNYTGSNYFTTTVHDITATSSTVVFAPDSNTPNGACYAVAYEVL